MPQGTNNSSPKIRTSEDILADECASAALAFLHLRRRVRAGDLCAVQEVARQSARIQHLAHTVEAAIRQRNESRTCVFLLVLDEGGDQ